MPPVVGLFVVYLCEKMCVRAILPGVHARREYLCMRVCHVSTFVHLISLFEFNVLI